jgi:hypothetical protein
MAVIYLKHPKHGTKVAISDLEADNDAQNGWEEYDPNATVDLDDDMPDEPAAPAAAEPEPEPVEPVNELQPRRRGRRPREIM